LADGTPKTQTNHGDTYTETQSSNGDQAVQFKDDPMQAVGVGPLGSMIIIPPGAGRSTLIRPRTSFVMEMYESVEKI
jgi:hypothetical protein